MHSQQENHPGPAHGAKPMAFQVHINLERHQANQQKSFLRNHRPAQVKDQTELSQLSARSGYHPIIRTNINKLPQHVSVRNVVQTLYTVAYWFYILRYNFF
jgi:hypothetical protein